MVVNILLGLGRLALGVFLMLLAFNVFSMPTNSFVVQRSVFFKLVAAVMIISGSYSVVYAILKPEKTKVEWNEEDKIGMIKNCLSDSGLTAKKYPKLTTQYCMCSIENITKSIKKEAYLLLLRKSLKDQLEAQYQYFEDCLDELNREIERLETSENL